MSIRRLSIRALSSSLSINTCLSPTCRFQAPYFNFIKNTIHPFRRLPLMISYS
nr:MAG TPA: hypothetical protein [Caudoviricetes sp.]